MGLAILTHLGRHLGTFEPAFDFSPQLSSWAVRFFPAEVQFFPNPAGKNQTHIFRVSGELREKMIGLLIEIG